MNNLVFHSKETRKRLRSSFIINSLAQCVEELILNSLDANSTSINIFVDTISMWLEVSDNGDGISQIDLELAGLENATSKYCGKSNRINLSHFGFRGEALSSIANLSSELIISSSYKGNVLSKKISNFGKVHSAVTVDEHCLNSGHGTTVNAKDIFSNLSIRAKSFVDVNEVKAIADGLLYIALLHWKVSFNFVEKKNSFQLVINKKNCLSSRFRQLFNASIIETLSLVKRELKVDIHLSIKEQGGISPLVRAVYVNKRFVKDNHQAEEIIVKCLSQGHNTHGFAKTCPFDWYDVGFEPSKTRIEFCDWDFVLSSIDQLLQEKSSLIGSNESRDNPLKPAKAESTDAFKQSMEHIHVATDMVCVMGRKAIKRCHAKQQPQPSENPIHKPSSHLVISHAKKEHEDENFLSDGWVEKYDIKRGKIYINMATGCSTAIKPTLFNKKAKQEFNVTNDSFSSWKLLPKNNILKTLTHQHSRTQPPELKLGTKLPSVYYSDDNKSVKKPHVMLFRAPCKISKENLLHMKVVGQLADKFIVCSHLNSIFLFDQHAVHERIRLERFIEESFEAGCDRKKLKSTKLNEALRVRISSALCGIVMRHGEVFKDLGFVLECETNGCLLVTSIPSMLHQREFLPSLVCDVIEDRAKNPHSSVALPVPLFNILASKACHGAIRFGDSLSRRQCSDLMEGISHCQLPFQCAHGRPSLFPLIDLSDVSKDQDLSYRCDFSRLKRLMTSGRPVK